MNGVTFAIIITLAFSTTWSILRARDWYKKYQSLINKILDGEEIKMNTLKVKKVRGGNEKERDLIVDILELISDLDLNYNHLEKADVEELEELKNCLNKIVGGKK